MKKKIITAGLALAIGLGASAAAKAETITVRIGSGHPPTVVYAGLMKTFFQPELKKAVESKTKYLHFYEVQV